MDGGVCFEDPVYAPELIHVTKYRPKPARLKGHKSVISEPESSNFRPRSSTEGCAARYDNRPKTLDLSGSKSKFKQLETNLIRNGSPKSPSPPVISPKPHFKPHMKGLGFGFPGTKDLVSELKSLKSPKGKTPSSPVATKFRKLTDHSEQECSAFSNKTPGSPLPLSPKKKVPKADPNNNRSYSAGKPSLSVGTYKALSSPPQSIRKTNMDAAKPDARVEPDQRDVPVRTSSRDMIAAIRSGIEYGKLREKRSQSPSDAKKRDIVTHNDVIRSPLVRDSSFDKVGVTETTKSGSVTPDLIKAIVHPVQANNTESSTTSVGQSKKLHSPSNTKKGFESPSSHKTKSFSTSDATSHVDTSSIAELAGLNSTRRSRGTTWLQDAGLDKFESVLHSRPAVNRTLSQDANCAPGRSASESLAGEINKGGGEPSCPVSRDNQVCRSASDTYEQAVRQRRFSQDRIFGANSRSFDEKAVDRPAKLSFGQSKGNEKLQTRSLSYEIKDSPTLPQSPNSNWENVFDDIHRDLSSMAFNMDASPTNQFYEADEDECLNAHIENKVNSEKQKERNAFQKKLKTGSVPGHRKLLCS